MGVCGRWRQSTNRSHLGYQLGCAKGVAGLSQKAGSCGRKRKPSRFAISRPVWREHLTVERGRPIGEVVDRRRPLYFKGNRTGRRDRDTAECRRRRLARYFETQRMVVVL